jgi:fumarate reductase subunit C
MTSRELAPREYVQPIRRSSWWLSRGTYFWFMIRELTALFVFIYVLFLLALVARAPSSDSFTRFFEYMKSPTSMGWHLAVLVMVLYHTVTFLNLTPKAIVLWRGEQKVPPAAIASAHYIVWIAVSLAVLWIALG